MEDFQVSHIEKQLPKLINNTRCTTLLKGFLRANDVVTEEEVEILTAAGNSHGAKREAKVLYDILKTRRGAYEALMGALEETSQSGALDILKAGQKNRVSETNEETMVQQLMEIPVELFGAVQSIRQHFPGLEKTTVLELLNDAKVKRQLADVGKNNTALKLTPDHPKLHALYIPRAISNRLLLDPAIFKRKCPDIFVFQGVDPGALADLVSPQVIRMSSTQLSVITSRHIHLDDEEDWEDLQIVAKAPLHLVYKDTDGYIVQRSTQVTSILHEHWLDKTRQRDAYLPEDKFVSQFIDEKHGKGALVCDVPGMGKTWLMQSIAGRVQLVSFKTIVFFIELDNFAKYLADKNEFPEVVDTLARVLQFVYDSKLSARLMRLYAERNDIKLLFVFDGFDEIPTVHIESITFFLKNLIAIKYIRFIISSRPNMRAHLEETFNSISFDILPFGKQEQVASIVNRWKETILDGDHKKLSKYAARSIDSFKIIGQKDRNDILGVPLQCYLLAVVHEKSARQVCNPNRQKDFFVPNIARVESICELYTLFFNVLIHKGVGKLSGGEPYNMQIVERFHTHKALELLFPEIAPVFLNSFETEAEIERFATKLGVMCESRQSRLEFIHRSFAEFLAGKFFAEFWMDITSHDPSVAMSVGSYFITNIMKPCGEIEYPEIFNYYHWKVYYKEKTRIFNIPKDDVSYSCLTVLSFMNSLYRKETPEYGIAQTFVQTLRCQQRRQQPWKWIANKILKRKNSLTLCEENIRKFSYINIIACVNHGFSSLLCLHVTLIKAFFKDVERLALLTITVKSKNQSPSLPFLLCYIAAFGCPENASEIFDIFDGSPENCLLKFCKAYPEKFWTPLEVAISRKNLEMVLFFNDKGWRNEERLLWTFLYRNKFIKADTKANTSIVKTVFGSVSRLCSRLSVPIFDPDYGYETLESLIMLAWAGRCSLRQASLENKRSFLHMALMKGTDKGLIKLLLLLFPKKHNDRFYFPKRLTFDWNDNISEYTGETVLQNLNVDGIKMSLSKNFPLVSPGIRNLETLKILIGIAPNLARCNMHGWNYLHHAVYYGNVDWVEYLIENGYEVNERDRDGNTPLHYIDPRTRGVQMTQKLVHGGADVYTLNKDKGNFVHSVCKYCKDWNKDDSEELSKWLKYLLDAGFGDIWKMKDCKGKTPLDLLSSRLGTGRPIIVQLLKLLHRRGGIIS